MSIRLIQYFPASRKEEPLRREFGDGAQAALEALRSEGRAPTAVVVEAAALGDLRTCAGLVVDRGRKHEKKPLGVLLLGHAPRIPVIEGSYTKPGRVRQGIDDLLANAGDKRDDNIYVIGTRRDVFDALWKHAGTAPSPPVRKQDGRPPEVEDLLSDRLEEKVTDLRERFTGDSPEFVFVRKMVAVAACCANPVLLLGETGTGKGILARAIHEHSVQKAGRFVEVNCAAIPEKLLESELFGSEPGAFTDASKRGKIGLWELAADGTLFLDEVADLHPEHQVKVLKALQEKVFRRVGGLVDIQARARIIAATNRDLDAMVRCGQFRKDLFYRLRGLVIYAPSLAQQPEVLPGIIRKAWAKITEGRAGELPEEIVADLAARHWPGNVRELKSLLRSIEAMFGTENLSVDHVRALLRYHGRGSGAAAGAPGDEVSNHKLECLRHLRRADELLRSVEWLLKPGAQAGAEGPLVPALQRRLAEMQNLSRHRLLFHAEGVYTEFESFREALSGLAARGSERRLGRCWREDLAADYARLVAAIFHEVRSLTA